jgi:hypothetical protein
MAAPSFKCFLTFREKLMALVNRRDPRDRAGLMVEDFVGDVRRDAEACHPGDAGSSQVV